MRTRGHEKDDADPEMRNDPAVNSAIPLSAQTDQVRFRGMDRNADGVMTRDEWRGSAGIVSGSRLERRRNTLGDEVGVGADRGDRTFEVPDFDREPGLLTTWSEASFRQIDRHRDGRMTDIEWFYDREGFIRADRDRDGVLARTGVLTVQRLGR